MEAIKPDYEFLSEFGVKEAGEQLKKIIVQKGDKVPQLSFFGQKNVPNFKGTIIEGFGSIELNIIRRYIINRYSGGPSNLRILGKIETDTKASASQVSISHEKGKQVYIYHPSRVTLNFKPSLNTYSLYVFFIIIGIGIPILTYVLKWEEYAYYTPLLMLLCGVFQYFLYKKEIKTTKTIFDRELHNVEKPNSYRVTPTIEA